MKEGKSSDRCCVYISGVGLNKETKLLGVPELPRGTGKAQKDAVTELLKCWNLKDEVIGMWLYYKLIKIKTRIALQG